jgi:hypothetical protein
MAEPETLYAPEPLHVEPSWRCSLPGCGRTSEDTPGEWSQIGDKFICPACAEASRVDAAAAGAFVEPLPFAVRAYEPGDKHYVLDSWLKGRLKELRAKHQGRRMRIADRHAWFRECRPRFAAHLEQHGASIACDPEKPSRILGYLVHGGGDVQFAHVKAWCDPFRDLILGALREHAGIQED